MRKITLETLKCYETEDWGADECRLEVVVDGVLQSPLRKDLNDGEKWMLNRSYTYRSNVEIKLWDEDSPDDDDLLGRFVIGTELATHTTVSFTGHGASYRLWYSVFDVPDPAVDPVQQAISTFGKLSKPGERRISTMQFSRRDLLKMTAGATTMLLLEGCASSYPPTVGVGTSIFKSCWGDPNFTQMPVDIFERPFAVDPNSMLMLPDGIFDKSKNVQLIGVYYTPMVDLATFDPHADFPWSDPGLPDPFEVYEQFQYVVEAPLESGIRILGPYLPPGASEDDLSVVEGSSANVLQRRKIHQANPTLRFILADFSNAQVGKHKLKFRSRTVRKSGPPPYCCSDERPTTWPGPWPQNPDQCYWSDFRWEDGQGWWSPITGWVEWEPEWDIEREIFVMETNFDYESNSFSVRVPEGTLYVEFHSASVWTDDPDWDKKSFYFNTPDGVMVAPLFTVTAPSYRMEADLEEGVLPTELRQEFLRNGYALAEAPAMKTLGNHTYQVQDGESEYILTFVWDFEILNVYSPHAEPAPMVFPKSMTATLVPNEPFSGVHAPLPFQDPLWKVALAVVGAALFIGSLFLAKKARSEEERGKVHLSVPFIDPGTGLVARYEGDVPRLECDVGIDGTICKRMVVSADAWETASILSKGVAGVAGGLYVGAVGAASSATLSISALSEPIDPFREGETNTVPISAGEVTVGETISIDFYYREQSEHPNDPFGVDLDWTFTRTTTEGSDRRTYLYKPASWQTKPMVTTESVVELSGNIQESIALEIDGQVEIIPIFKEKTEVTISALLRKLAEEGSFVGTDVYVTAQMVGNLPGKRLAILTDEDQDGRYSASFVLEEGMHTPVFEVAYDDSYFDGLNQGRLAAGLHSEFEARGIVLAPDADVQDASFSHWSWKASDGSNVYWIALEGAPERFQVYAPFSIWRVHVVAQSVNKAQPDDEPIVAAAQIGGRVLNETIRRRENSDCTMVVQAYLGIVKEQM